MISGIYEIKNTLDNKRYIGSSVNIDKRWGEHRSQLNTNKHCNAHLQRSWNKYGDKPFEFKLLEQCEPIRDTLLSIEQKYLDLEPEYNICKIAGSTQGIEFTDERKRKIGEANSRRVWSEESKLKVSNWAKEVNKLRAKRIDMICLLTGEVLKTFDSMSDAARYTGHINHRVSIKRVIQGKQYKAYGYNWKLKQ